MVVANPPLAVVHPPLFGMKGSFQCPQHLHILRNQWSVSDSNKTPLINLHVTHIWSLSVSAVNTENMPRNNMNFHYTTQLCFLQDCYFPLEHVILMTTAYDIRLVQKLCYLLPKSVVDMVVVHPPLAVVHPPLAVVHPPLYGMKGCFQCPHNLHILRNQWSVPKSNKTQLINLHITHIIWLLSDSAVNMTKYIPPIIINFHYTTQLLLPLRTSNFNNSL
jgi:hypothetical protein